jgi:hypothetical protein
MCRLGGYKFIIFSLFVSFFSIHFSFAMQDRYEPDGFKFIREKEKLFQINVNGILEVSKALHVYARLVFKKSNTTDMTFYSGMKKNLKENDNYIAGDLLAQVYERYLEYLDSEWNEKIRLGQGRFCFVGENRIFSDIEYDDLLSNEDARHPWQRWAEYLINPKKKKKEVTRKKLRRKIRKLREELEGLEGELERREKRLKYVSKFLVNASSGEWKVSDDDYSKAQKEYNKLTNVDEETVKGQRRKIKRRLRKATSQLSLLGEGGEQD